METTETSRINEIVGKVTQEVSKTIYGNEEIATMLLGAILVGGHVLLEGPPGVAKTLIAKCFSRALGLKMNRIQFTPDLMPSDVTGVTIFDQSSSEFSFAPGPIFADIVLADEINRTPPKTQSALLEAMQERFVTVDGKRHALGTMFSVIATQNPLEHEGTFPLPEAQLDRFLFKLRVSYPDAAVEQEMIQRFSSEMPESMREVEASVSEGVVTREELQQARLELRKINIDSSVTAYIQQLVSETRTHQSLLLGASPRAALNLALAAKFAAARDNRSYVLPDDVQAVAESVLAHRLVYEPGVFSEISSAEHIVAQIVAQVAVPNGL